MKDNRTPPERTTGKGKKTGCEKPRTRSLCPVHGVKKRNRIKIQRCRHYPTILLSSFIPFNHLFKKAELNWPLELTH